MRNKLLKINNNAPKVNGVIGNDFTKEELEKICIEKNNGFLFAYLDLIIHNQFVLNHRLNNILDKLNEKTNR